ncbi:hypothetical protein G7Y89_g11987 [Cudoniella acicularis]|uniref:NAD-dependent epimerase/dehydratase domain-containing protein n=1 Tax=Cudoniella acicularis TaxID=354080 RepID=A0A8H4R9Y1_9HELO|nr:hypothetical protein G7Y89_g11987 [Cudoniella acicularis]
MSKHILLTGANGYLGTHILTQLLQSGHTVNAVVRSAEKAAQVQSLFPTYTTQKALSTTIVPSITSPGAFNTAVQSTPPFNAVIHSASPFLYRAISSNTEFLDPAIKGTLEVLKAVKEFAPSVERVVITSSMAAVVNFSAPFVSEPRKVYSEEDWNPTSWEGALSGTPGNAYQASKKFAELAAWDFIKNEKPNFDLVTFNPPMIYGPIAHSVKNVKELNESTARIYNLFINSSSSAPLPPNGLHLYVDVRDIALAHLKALTTPEAGGKRFVICEGGIGSQEISDLLRANIPGLKERTPEGVPGSKGLDANVFAADTSRAEKILGMKYRSREETFVELARQLLSIEKEGGVQE